MDARGNPGLRERGSAQQEEVLRIVAAAARAGKPCPKNGEIADQMNTSPSQVCELIKRLERRGLVKVTRFSCSRIVEIVGAGIATASPPGSHRLHWRIGGRRQHRLRNAQAASLANKGKSRGLATVGVDRHSGDPKLGDADIHRRREAVTEARREHERRWLEAEAERYGLARVGKPLSEMPA